MRFVKSRPHPRAICGTLRPASAGHSGVGAGEAQAGTAGAGLHARDQEPAWEDAAVATVRSNTIRALFLAAGLNQEAGFRLPRDDKKAAARLFQKALNASTEPSPITTSCVCRLKQI